MNYRVTWEQDTADAMDNFNAATVRRILVRINWLAKNLDNIKLQALSGTLKGYFKLRVGNYRVIYTLNREEREIVIEYLGHRSNIYKLP